jgi:Flp pilus assembly protein TadG
MRNDRGQAALELVVMTPCLIALVLVIVAGARLVSARGDLEATAREATRAAVQASPASVSNIVQQVASQVATGYGMDPARLQLAADGTLTRGSTFKVVARYRVSLAPMPGSITLEVTRTEPVDPFRSFG